MLIETKTAAELCDFPDADLKRRFELTLKKVEARYLQKLIKNGASTQQANQQIEIARTTAIQKIQSLGAEGNCNSKTMKNHSQRYRIYAKRSR